MFVQNQPHLPPFQERTSGQNSSVFFGKGGAGAKTWQKASNLWKNEFGNQVLAFQGRQIHNENGCCCACTNIFAQYDVGRGIALLVQPSFPGDIGLAICNTTKKLVS
jgi:hypothetical protein